MEQRRHLEALLHGAKLRDSAKVLEKVIALLLVLQFQNGLIELIVLLFLSNFNHNRHPFFVRSRIFETLSDNAPLYFNTIVRESKGVFP